MGCRRPPVQIRAPRPVFLFPHRQPATLWRHSWAPLEASAWRHERHFRREPSSRPLCGARGSVAKPTVESHLRLPVLQAMACSVRSKCRLVTSGPTLEIDAFRAHSLFGCEGAWASDDCLRAQGCGRGGRYVSNIRCGVRFALRAVVMVGRRGESDPTPPQALHRQAQGGKRVVVVRRSVVRSPRAGPGRRKRCGSRRRSLGRALGRRGCHALAGRTLRYWV